MIFLCFSLSQSAQQKFCSDINSNDRFGFKQKFNNNPPFFTKLTIILEITKILSEFLSKNMVVKYFFECACRCDGILLNLQKRVTIQPFQL